MRIAIDMQGAQTGSETRGLGGYTISLCQAIVRNRSDHEIYLALNGLLPETIEPLRAAFDGFLPQDNIRVWYAPGPIMESESGNDNRRKVAELVREAFLASLQPDIILISNLLGGYYDNVVSSIGSFDQITPVSVLLYYQTFLLNQAPPSPSEPGHEFYRRRKGEYLEKATVCLAVSDEIAQDASRKLALESSKIISLEEAGSRFRHCAIEDNKRSLSNEGDPFFADFEACDTEYWDKCAIRAVETFASVVHQRSKFPTRQTVTRRQRLAFVSPFPPERSGVADYSATLLPPLSEYYDIDIVVAQDRVLIPSTTPAVGIRDVAWFRAHSSAFDHVLYHIGNSPFHQHILHLLIEIPGVVVLHDFFIGHLRAYIERFSIRYHWIESIYSSHGYSAIGEYYRDPEAAKFNYPANFEIFEHSFGVVVHSEFTRQLIGRWYGGNCATKVEMVPLLRAPAENKDKITARKRLGIDEDALVVCSFGFLGPTKLNHSLLESWLKSGLSHDRRCRLMFVGENDHGQYGKNLLNKIKKNCSDSGVVITGYIEPEMYQHYLTAADIAVQLRTQSRGEMSASVLDCLNNGLPVIVNANGSMAELDPHAVWLLPDEFDDAALVEALEALWKDPGRRSTMGTIGRQIILNRHTPAQCATRYAEAIERSYHRASTLTPNLIKAIASAGYFDSNGSNIEELSEMLAVTFPPLQPARRLFFDVSATCRNDLKTGIQRVVRAVLFELIQNPPNGFRIEPVYLSDRGGVKWHYRYARVWTSQTLGFPCDWASDDPVDFLAGDVMLVADFTGSYVVESENSQIFQQMRHRGVSLHFIVYDLLPILMPNVFPPGQFRFSEWLTSVCRVADQAICISKSVANELHSFVQTSPSNRAKPMRISHFHLGANLENSFPTMGFPDNYEENLLKIRATVSFLMVGTIEPRKAYLQAIEAFNQLWSKGTDINLIIVGKEGWTHLPDDMRRDIPETINFLQNHPELNRRLFWLEGISDEYLESVYAACTCLITASYGEGFGLPLIEAAQRKLPIIARDIPVFREVAGEHAYFFDGKMPHDIEKAVTEWLQLFSVGQHRKSDDLPWYSWKESTHILMEIVLGNAIFKGCASEISESGFNPRKDKIPFEYL